MKNLIARTLLGTALLLGGTAHAAEKPNILYILTDQWRGTATGYAGDPNVKTPNIDRLAKESLIFRNAVSACPVCTPHRASLMTGRFPTSTGMFLNDAYLPSEEVCMAEILNAAGYATGFIGKWHLDGHGRTDFVPPDRRQGWDYWKANECSHDYNRSPYYTGNDPTMKYWDGYDAFAQTKDAQSYLKAKAGGKQPFALMVSFGPPHFPHPTAPDEYKKMYPPGRIEVAPNVPDAMRQVARKESQGYYAHCTALDRCVGDLVATLAEAGLAENTIVVFTSDHGESMGSHGNSPRHKVVPWDESARVPLLLRYPAAGGPKGVTVKTPITTPDILPTLLGLAGVPVPESVEGDDLSKLVRDPTFAEDRAALYEIVSPFALSREGEANNREYRAVRTKRYTYVRDRNGPWLLYDDEADPLQMNNLVGRPDHAALEKDLDARLQAELKKHGDEFRDSRYYLSYWGYKVEPGNSVPYGPGAAVQSPTRQPPGE